MGLLHEIIIGPARRHEHLVETCCDPWIAREDIRFDDDRMHDGKDLCLFVVLSFFAFEVREEPRHRSFAANPTRREIRLRLRIYFPLE